MAQRLTLEQRKRFAQTFVELDTDGNGVLSREEVGVWLDEQGYDLTAQGKEKVFRWMDSNADGQITLDEFLNAMALLQSDLSSTSRDSRDESSSASSRGAESQSPEAGGSAENLLEIFNAMDLNGDGLLCEDELLHGLTRAGCYVNRRQVKQLMTTLDTDEDGHISYSQFVAVYKGWYKIVVFD